MFEALSGRGEWVEILLVGFTKAVTEDGENNRVPFDSICMLETVLKDRNDVDKP